MDGWGSVGSDQSIGHCSTELLKIDHEIQSLVGQLKLISIGQIICIHTMKHINIYFSTIHDSPSLSLLLFNI